MRTQSGCERWWRKSKLISALKTTSGSSDLCVINLCLVIFILAFSCSSIYELWCALLLKKKKKEKMCKLLHCRLFNFLGISAPVMLRRSAKFLYLPGTGLLWSYSYRNRYCRVVAATSANNLLVIGLAVQLPIELHNQSHARFAFCFMLWKCRVPRHTLLSMLVLLVQDQQHRLMHYDSCLMCHS